MRSIVVLVLLGLPLLMCGQLEYWGLAGGAVDVGFEQADEVQQTNVNFGVRIGKFVSEKVAIGAAFQIGYENSVMGKDRTSITQTGIGAFVRAYFAEKGKWHFYAEPTLMNSKIYSTEGAFDVMGESGDRVDYLRGMLGIGTNCFVGKNVAFSFQLDANVFERLKFDDASLADAGKLEASIGLQFFADNYTKKSFQRKQPILALAAENWNIGGSIIFQDRLTTQRSLIVNPSIAYFTAKQFAIGFGFEGDYNLEEKLSIIAVSSFLRYHVPVGRNYLYVEGGGGISVQKIRITTPEGMEAFDAVSRLFGQGKLGLGIFLSKYTALQGGLRYRYIVPFGSELDFKNATTNIGLEVGIQYFLDRSTKLSDQGEEL